MKRELTLRKEVRLVRRVRPARIPRRDHPLVRNVRRDSIRLKRDNPLAQHARKDITPRGREIPNVLPAERERIPVRPELQAARLVPKIRSARERLPIRKSVRARLISPAKADIPKAAIRAKVLLAAAEKLSVRKDREYGKPVAIR